MELHRNINQLFDRKIIFIFLAFSCGETINLTCNFEFGLKVQKQETVQLHSRLRLSTDIQSSIGRSTVKVKVEGGIS